MKEGTGNNNIIKRGVKKLNIKCEVIVEQGLKSFFIFYLQIIKFRN